ncbi:hypothetical protein GEMRC1_010885 [Eukaryota sp. GEM-RC1]
MSYSHSALISSRLLSVIPNNKVVVPPISSLISLVQLVQLNELILNELLLPPLMMKGFPSFSSSKLGCKVSGGQTVLNPKFLIGGTVMSVTLDSTLMKPTGARLGGSLILTKPLGTQVISNVARSRDVANCFMKE